MAADAVAVPGLLKPLQRYATKQAAARDSPSLEPFGRWMWTLKAPEGLLVASLE